MAITAAKLAILGQAALDLHLKNKPIDQIGTERPLLKMLMDNKKPTGMGKEFIVEKLRKSYDSNFQWYYGGATVTYNTKDTLSEAKFSYGSAHDGFTADEDDFVRAGIVVSDEQKEPTTADEKVKLRDLFVEWSETLLEGFEEKLDYELHLDGSQHADAIAGLDHLVSTTGTGTVGSINSTTSAWWQNNFQTGVAAGTLIANMQLQKRNIEKYGSKVRAIFMGETAYAEYESQADAKISRQVNLGTSGQAASFDAGISDLYFHGVPVFLDHTMTEIQEDTSASVDWKKRIYMIDDRNISYKPLRGHDMVSRKPERAHNSYNWYWGLTHKVALTTNKRRAHAVLALA